MRRTIGLVLCSVLLGSLPASAHHALTAYNRNQSKTVEGVVKEFRFANPHARLILVVPGQDGTMKEWDFEGGGVRRLQNRGLTAGTIAAGDKITVSYNPMRSGAPGGFFVGLTTADGKTYGTRP
jgi:Family of unknown function (DUF6152)